MLDWLFGKENNKSVNFSHIGIDIHSHMIPGIDDGVQTIGEAVEMASEMQSLGYTHLVTTPHVMWDCYRNTPEIIQNGLRDVQAAVRDAGLSIQIAAAAEYFIDEHFNEMLSSGQQLLTLPGNRLLVELPYSTPLLNTSENLFNIVSKGYQPVLAHPERYTYFHPDPSVYKRLVDAGCELQINLLSLTGYYGEAIFKTVEWLLKNNLVTFVGTDAHKVQHLTMARKADKHRWLTKYPFQNEKLTRI